MRFQRSSWIIFSGSALEFVIVAIQYYSTDNKDEAEQNLLNQA
jgi:hypothetical protein